ncbi:MAG TPA: TolC family protein [bacterium]|nr:TolC family protein [bacterium]
MKSFVRIVSMLVLLPAASWGAPQAATDAPAAAPDTSQRKVIAPAGTETVRALTLKECYRLALKQSELIAIRGELIKEAEAHFLQAFGTVMPQASFVRAERRQHSDITPSANKGFDQQFVFTQLLFSGFKEIARMSASKFEKKSRTDEKTRAEQLLFTDVSDAFYLLLELRDDLETLDVIKKALMERVAELKEREAIGKSRASEVVMTQVQLYTLEAEVELVRAQERVARELLEFLIGGPADEIVDPDASIAVKPECDYVAEAPSRKDVTAAYEAWQAALKRITVARSGYFPTVNIEGDVYTHRFSSPQDAHWAAYFTVDVPVFTGTIVYGDVMQATAIARENELLYQRAKRVAVREIHDAYTIVEAALRRSRILENAQKAAEENYRLQTEDYKLNCVNNLDVLSSIQTLNNTRREHIHAEYQAKRYFWQLLTAAGEIDTDQ